MKTNGSAPRQASIHRATKETDISVEWTLDGSGLGKIDTGIRFFDHMLELLSKHGFFDLTVKAKGDIDIDEHHTVEDVGIVMGKVAIDEKPLKLDLDRIVQEAQQAMMKQYAHSGLSRILCEKLEDCDTIVQNNGHFLVLLPETMPDDLPGLIERLRQQVSDQLGIELSIGAASLPQDSYTLEGLVAKATSGMKTGLVSELFIDVERISLKEHVSRY